MCLKRYIYIHMNLIHRTEVAIAIIFTQHRCVKQYLLLWALLHRLSVDSGRAFLRRHTCVLSSYSGDIFGGEVKMFTFQLKMKDVGRGGRYNYAVWSFVRVLEFLLFIFKMCERVFNCTRCTRNFVLFLPYHIGARLPKAL